MELAKIIYRYEKELSHTRLLPQQRKALQSIKRCRTPASGQMNMICPCCGRRDQYCLSCGHRSCPKCQNFETTQWLERQREKLLPVDYFLVTFTLPSQLRLLVWKHQKIMYNLLFETASQALCDLSAHPRFLGGKIGMTGVLHTHNRRLDFHPHLHFIVPAGALVQKKKYWITSASKFLVPQTALNRLFRGKFLAGLKPYQFPFSQTLYQIDWVVHCQRVGQGKKALEYLARYLYRGVLPENKILSDQEGEVTFSYTESKTGERKKRTLPGPKFLQLLLQHVLPKGFRRIRDYGFLHGNAKKTLHLLQIILKPQIRENPAVRRPALLCPDCQKPMKILTIQLKGGRLLIRKRGSPLLIN